MRDSKEAYKKILEEQVEDLKAKPMHPYSLAQVECRYNTLITLGFKRNEINTIKKIEKLIKKYN